MSLISKSKIKSLYRVLVDNVCLKPYWVWRLIANPDKYCKHKSYYPDSDPKSYGKILYEQLGQILHYGKPNVFYFPYGHDVKTTDERDAYFHYLVFARLRNKLNRLSTLSGTFILRDKLYFGIFTNAFGIKSGENLAIIEKQKVFNLKLKVTETIESFIKSNFGEFFIKQIDGECGVGIFKILIEPNRILCGQEEISVSQLRCIVGNNGRYLIQRCICQHPAMMALHRQSLNTIRLVTIKNIVTDEIALFPSILRIGVGDSFVDNTSQGGLAVGIDSDSGSLMKYGYFKPEYGTKVCEHPDSSIVFKNYQIPFWNEAVAQAKLLHHMLPGIQSIGWDIAISPDGPVFVEGNDNWEINGPQICHGPLKEKFLNMAGKL